MPGEFSLFTTIEEALDASSCIFSPSGYFLLGGIEIRQADNKTSPIQIIQSILSNIGTRLATSDGNKFKLGSLVLIVAFSPFGFTILVATMLNIKDPRP